jgi:hypothetical protein
VAAAARGYVGNTPAAEAGHDLCDRVGLVADLRGKIGRAAAADWIQVKRQYPPGSRAGVINGHRARLARRVGRQRASVPGGVSAAAVAGNPNVWSACYRKCDRMPGGLCGGAREAVRIARVRCRDTRRVARGPC